MGDCWLMGTMASIAEHPAHLKSIFGISARHKDNNGRYIYIYIDAWKMVDVVGFVALGNHGYVNVQTSCTTWDV